jgi:hypothetical protein
VKQLVLALAISAALGAAAASASEPASSVYLAWGISTDGRGHAFAAPLLDGAWGLMTWEACAPDGACTAVAPSADNDKVLEVGDAPAGTTFVASTSDGTRSISATSPPYRGRLVLYSVPTVVGTARTGHFVRPLPGMWFGGWGDERPLMQLQVCRTRRDPDSIGPMTASPITAVATVARIKPGHGPARLC